MNWVVRGLISLPGSLARAGPGVVVERLYRRLLLFAPRKQRFEAIAAGGGFGSSPSLSGTGSTLEMTAGLRNYLPRLIERRGLRSLLDIPCGDFWWMRSVELGEGVLYLGADIVELLIRKNSAQFAGAGRNFMVRDVCTDPLPRADLVLCRDCMIHLKNRECASALRNLRASGSRFFLLTTYPELCRNPEIGPQWCRNVNLELPPFGLPRPLELFREEGPANEGKALGLWRNEDLPSGERSAEGQG